MILRTLDSVYWRDQVVEIFFSKVVRVLNEKKRCRMILTGGKSATEIYKMMATRPSINIFSSVDIYLSDERCVCASSEDSNYQGILNNLFSDGIPKGCFLHQMYRITETPNGAAERCCEEFPDSFDVSLLSVGLDGHFASLFSGSSATVEVTRPVVAVESANHPFQRVTITPAILDSIKNTYVLAIGSRKASIISDVARGNKQPICLPAMLLRSKAEWLTCSDLR